MYNNVIQAVDMFKFFIGYGVPKTSLGKINTNKFSEYRVVLTFEDVSRLGGENFITEALLLESYRFYILCDKLF